jgi:nucleoside-diphosphate-sugar epimerase
LNGIHLVTGGAGYFGSLLVKRLVRAGKRVRVLDIHDADLPVGVEKVQGDVRDAMAVVRAFADVEVVHHNVALVPLARSRRTLFEINVGGTRNVLEAAKRTGVRKVVHMSSSAIYGAPKLNPVDDFTPLRPRDSFGRAKLAAEKVCLDYAEKGLDVTIIRPATIVGHGRLGIMQILFEWVRQGRTLPVLGKGDNLYQFVHAADLASACQLAAEQSEPAIFNIGAERFGTMRQTLDALCAHAQTGSRVTQVPASAAIALRLTSGLGLSPLSSHHVLMYGRSKYFDLARPKRALGWSPKFSNDEMFIEAYDWYLAHRQEVAIRAQPTPRRVAVREGVLDVALRALSTL